MSQPTAAFLTLGCKINQYETEAIRQEILGMGYREVSFGSSADVYVVNTCAVTSTASSKSRRTIQRALRKNPQARVVVVGCSTPADKDGLAAHPQVALLAGNEDKAMVSSFLSGAWKPGDPRPERRRDILDLNLSRYQGRTRAVVKVQDGCDKFCSFCIIPFLRGRSKSRPAAAILDEVRRLVADGLQEVVVSGVHLEDYGTDLDPALGLPSLLRRLVKVPGLRRLRLSSLGPGAFTAEVLDLLADPVFCRHWHIPLQAGSDAVLKRMRRWYTLDDFRRTVADLRRRFEEPSITTDVIVGHPGETEADFENTLEVCRELRFSKIHVFPFSVREGTLASKFPDRVEPLEIRRRARVLGQLERELGLDYKRRFVGKVLDVLAETEGEDDTPDSAGDTEMLEGLADRYLRVRFPAPSAGARHRFLGTLQEVRVIGVGERALEGEWAGTVS